jgi:hypothetical protein
VALRGVEHDPDGTENSRRSKSVARNAQLKLHTHPDKTSIGQIEAALDFLG